MSIPSVEQAEHSIGLRCGCGTPLGDGFEWVIITLRTGPDGLQRTVTAVQTCTDPACGYYQAAATNSGTTARRAIAWDRGPWPLPEPGL